MSRQSYLAAMVLFSCGWASQAEAQQAQTVPTIHPPERPQRPAAEAPPEQPRPDVILQADRLIEDRQLDQVIAEGDVEVRVEDRVLKADRLVYVRSKGTMRASGHVQITNADGSIQFADDIEADDEFANGFATRFALRLPGSGGVGPSTATASAAIRSSDGQVHSLEQAVYTNCPVCETKPTPSWSLRASHIEQNSETQLVTYQDAVLELFGVPVLYLPYFAHPDPTSERRSGLLIPDLGSSSKLGLNYEQPYYWAISPSQDMTLRPVIFANVNPLLKIDYRKKFFSGFVAANASFTNEKEFDSHGDKFGDETWRSHLYANGAFDIDETWKWGFGVERQSDDLYDHRYDIDGEDDLRGLFASQPRQLLTQLYAVGQTPDFYFQTEGLLFQGLREGDDDARFPKVAPALFLEKVYDFGALGQLATDVSALALMRDAQQTLPNSDLVLDTARVSAKANWKSRYIARGFVMEPFAQGRGDFYRIDNGCSSLTTPSAACASAPADAYDVNRFLGLAGGQISYPVIRRGKMFDLMIEPIVMVGYGSKDTTSRKIPNEDSLLFESDESNLFDPASVTNYDIWEGGGRLAVGVSASARFGDGYDISGLFGRRWREEADPTFSASSNLGGKKSDYVASLKTTLGPYLQAGARARLNDDFEVSRLDIDTRADIWRLHGEARYFNVKSSAPGVADQEGLVLGGNFQVTKNWSALFYDTRNIELGRDIRLAIGIAYRDECSYFAITYEHSGAIDRSLGQSDNIRFTFALTGLGAVSDDRFD